MTTITIIMANGIILMAYSTRIFISLVNICRTLHIFKLIKLHEECLNIHRYDILPDCVTGYGNDFSGGEMVS